MRIAVSGTHCSGKTTLVESFAAAHPDYVHEPEPYEWLEDGEAFAAEPDAGDFFRQLEVCVDHLTGYGRGSRVIAERSPLDFLAYLLACADLGRGGSTASLTEAAVELAATGMQHLDVVVILPLDGSIPAPESEDPELREAMNDRLLELITADEYDLLSNGRVRVVELHGAPQARLALLERALITGRSNTWSEYTGSSR